MLICSLCGKKGAALEPVPYEEWRVTGNLQMWRCLERDACVERQRLQGKGSEE